MPRTYTRSIVPRGLLRGADRLDELGGGAEGEAGDGLVLPAQDAPAVDHEDRPAVEAERAEDAVGVPHHLVGVGEEREGEPALLAAELVVADDRLRAERQHLRADLGEAVDVV